MRAHAPRPRIPASSARFGQRPAIGRRDLRRLHGATAAEPPEPPRARRCRARSGPARRSGPMRGRRTRRPACPCAPGLGGHRDQPQHGRMQRIDRRPRAADWSRSMASAYCARSLVPIDRKSASRRKPVGDQRRCRRLDHDAERGVAWPKLARQALRERRAAQRPTRPSAASP